MLGTVHRLLRGNGVYVHVYQAVMAVFEFTVVPVVPVVARAAAQNTGAPLVAVLLTHSRGQEVDRFVVEDTPDVLRERRVHSHIETLQLGPFV